MVDQMLTDPNDIDHCNDALDKLGDATDKLCDLRESTTISSLDRLVAARAINQIAHHKQQLSLLLPPDPAP